MAFKAKKNMSNFVFFVKKDQTGWGGSKGGKGVKDQTFSRFFSGTLPIGDQGKHRGCTCNGEQAHCFHKTGMTICSCKYMLCNFCGNFMLRVKNGPYFQCPPFHSLQYNIILTFSTSQVLALVTHPPLLESDEFPEDAKDRSFLPHLI